MSECELPEFYCEQLVVARKPYKCCDTKLPIAKGEKYWRITGKWDGSIQTHAQSEMGYKLCRRINVDYIEECEIGFGGLYEWLGDFVEQADDDKLKTLYAAKNWSGILAWFDVAVEEKNQRREQRRQERASLTAARQGRVG